ncbi:MAG: glycosyltransferase [Gammaproteobacteria bacterium]|nr:glycosyltransferase [Gammaproteobacteria bacterium]
MIVLKEQAPRIITADNEPIDILVVTRKLDIGGTERHLLDVLPRLNRGLLKVFVCVLRGGGALEDTMKAAGVEVCTPPWQRPKSLRIVFAAFYLLGILIHRRPSIVHFFLPEASIVGGLCALVASGATRIISRRSLNDYQRKHPVLAHLERWVQMRTDAMLGNSRAVVNQLRDEGVPSNKLGLIYNGVDVQLFDRLGSARALRQSLGLPETALILVIVATLIPHKGHVDLLRALKTVVCDLPKHWLLLCIGRDDGIGDGLQEEAQSLGIEKHIRWLGERIDVPQLLKAADIGISASHQEGFSNSVLECMAARLPIVVTNVGGNVEAVIDGVTGLVVPRANPGLLGKAILALASDPERRTRMGLAGRQRVKMEFSLDESVAQYLRLYSGLAKPDSSPLSAILGSN